MEAESHNWSRFLIFCWAELVLWDEPNVEYLDIWCFGSLTASTTSEVKNDHAHVLTQDVSNKFIEVNFCVECMVWQRYHLFHRLTTMSLIDKIKGDWKRMSLCKWPCSDHFWPFFCHLYVYLSQNWGLDGHFEVLNRSKS